MVLHLCIMDVDITRIERLRKKFTGVVVYEVVARSPLQSNIFSNDQDVRVLSVGTHNHNTASYTKNDFKEIKHGNQVAPKSSEYEKRVCEINDYHEYDFLHE